MPISFFERRFKFGLNLFNNLLTGFLGIFLITFPDGNKKSRFSVTGMILNEYDFIIEY